MWGNHLVTTQERHTKFQHSIWVLDTLFLICFPVNVHLVVGRIWLQHLDVCHSPRGAGLNHLKVSQMGDRNRKYWAIICWFSVCLLAGNWGGKWKQTPSWYTLVHSTKTTSEVARPKPESRSFFQALPDLFSQAVSREQDSKLNSQD